MSRPYSFTPLNGHFFSMPIHQKATLSKHSPKQPYNFNLSPHFSIMADQDSNQINLPLALSSSTPSWWDLHHHATRPTLSTSLRNNTGGSGVDLWEPHSHLSASTCDHEDVSISASNHSSLTVDESSHRLVGTPSSNYIVRELSSTDNNIHVWSQVLLGAGGSQELSRDIMGKNLLNGRSLKCFSGGMFETTACGDYLRKLDSHHHDKWAEISENQYPNVSEFFTDGIDKQSIKSNSCYNDDVNFIENNDHQTSLNTWSIAPPDQPQLIEHIASHPCNDNIPLVDQYIQPDITTGQTKQGILYQSQSFGMGPASIFECEHSSLNHQMRQENDQCGGSEQVGLIQATLFPMASFINPGQSGNRPVGDYWRPKELNMLSQHGYTTPSVIDPLSKFSSKTRPNSISLLNATKQHAGIQSNSSMTIKGNGRGQGSVMNGAKQKRDNDAFQSSSSLKKPKRDNSASNPSSASSSAKITTMRTPKGKVEAEKLALQQIVSPYGKTDTASILQEAIGFIRRHQETIQAAMLSNPYMKSSANKLQEAWGSLDRKGDRNKVLDLKSKGLCLVPISSIPQEIKEDNSGLDYWPAYRGYLYR